MHLTEPDMSVSTSALYGFRANILNQDDVFQPDFYCNVVFYGNQKDNVQIEPGIPEELAAWNTQTLNICHWQSSDQNCSKAVCFCKKKNLAAVENLP